MKTMNHALYKEHLRHKTDKELQYIIKDANEAIDALPHKRDSNASHFTFYSDEVLYAAEELRRRQKARQRLPLSRIRKLFPNATQCDCGATFSSTEEMLARHAFQCRDIYAN